MFTDEQMIEIGRARERLLKFKNKIQCYPPYPNPPKPQIQEPEVWQPRQWDELQQYKGRLIHLENKIAEMRAKKKDVYTIK